MLIWEQSFTQSGAREREGCRIYHYVYLMNTQSNRVYCFDSLDAFLFSDYLEVARAVVVSCVGPKSLHLHRYNVIFTYSGPLGLLSSNLF